MIYCTDIQLDWSRISGNIIELPSVNYSRTYIMLHIVVNVRNRRLRFDYPPNPKLIFWISNNPRPSNFYILIIKKKGGPSRIIKFNVRNPKEISIPNYEDLMFNILLTPSCWILTLLGHSVGIKKMDNFI